jgi:hypothetical protein
MLGLKDFQLLKLRKEKLWPSLGSFCHYGHVIILLHYHPNTTA